MKNIFSKKILLLVAITMSLTATGQGVKSLRINEVLVKNDSDYVDPYGVRSGWFEVFNTGYAMADIGGCYVTNDINNPTKYRVPKGNPRTQIAARAYALFFAYDKGDRGIFHVNFSLDEKGFLAIYDQSGKELIDSVNYDISAQKPDRSFGKMENEPVKNAHWYFDLEPTPEAINYVTVEKTRSEKYEDADPYGIIITITTMSVVFFVLILLAFIFKQTGKYFKRKAEVDKANKELQLLVKTGKYIKNTGKYIKGKVEMGIHHKTEEKTVEQQPDVQDVKTDNELDIAAIAMALHLHFDDQHEVEQTGFWLNRSLNHQTTWTSKNILFKKSPLKKK